MSGSRGILLDTNIVLHATRINSKVSAAIDAQFGLSTSWFRPAISEVSVGELLAFTLSSRWGEKRKELLRAFACRIGAIERLKAVQRISYAKLDELCVSLQSRAFRGDL